ncbi:hypothetical protein FACS1894188_01360 [Clostridia bacterium]|nr:hypothetical protein FACS1894188_01360 [Clostridia bacterium]
MLTEFGRVLRKIRIDHAEIIKDMAEKLGVTASYVSTVETGKRNIPENWVEQISGMYNLDDDNRQQLKNAAEISAKCIKLNLDNLALGRRETAILFAREFEKIDEDTVLKIKSLLRKEEE